MGLEGARRSEFTKLVADHFFRNVNGNEFVAVVNLECQAHKLRDDRGAAAPRLDGGVALPTGGFGLLQHVPVYKRAFPD